MSEDAPNASQSVNITFPHNNTACVFDIQVKCHDNDVEAKWSNVDLRKP